VLSGEVELYIKIIEQNNTESHRNDEQSSGKLDEKTASSNNDFYLDKNISDKESPLEVQFDNKVLDDKQHDISDNLDSDKKCEVKRDQETIISTSKVDSKNENQNETIVNSLEDKSSLP